MRHYFTNRSNYGKLVLLIGLLLIIPLAILPFYPNESKYAVAFIIPSLISIILGVLICRFSKQDDNTTHWQLTMQKGSLTVLFAWGYGFIAGAIPFMISGKLSFIQALFEAVSGWTTTGLSVMDVSVTPQIFLFHRSFMQFCGGLGFVMVMIMFVQGKQAMNLYNAEGHPDKLMPNLKKTVWTIFLMYVSLLFAGTIIYILLGMNPFDSLIHAMSALSTGGFSTKVDSIGAYHSLAIEAFTIILMLIGTTNFAVLLLITKRKFKQVQRVSEIRFLTILLVIFVPVLALSLLYGLYMTVGESFRVSLFNVVSALSTTGYSTTTYTNWPPLAIGILIILMLTGGGIGSTAGGIKLTRVYIILRTTFDNIRKRLSPEHHVEVPYYYKAQGKTSIDRTLASDVTGFVACYLSIFAIGSLLLTVTLNCSLADAMFEFASSLGTVGLSIGLTGPSTGAATLIVEIFGMILGRLEIFIVLIGIYSGVFVFKEYLRSREK
ncbi:MAG: cation transporter [Clostridiales bacterium GWF2_38_85]|nr:MAG: cation transporter [Clostridiales bacterium GWF2_38_85]HBL83986.1 cation transporter [Clostridiales bacterium]